MKAVPIHPAEVTSVIVIDDHRLIRDGLAAALRGSGLQVAGAFADAEPALSCARQEPISVAVVDVLLAPAPGALSGLELIRGLRALSQPPAVLVLSAAGDAETVGQAYAAGAAAYLHKGDADADFVVKAVDALARGQALPRATPDGSQTELDAAGVTPREREVLAHVGTAADNLQIAAYLQISEHTVKVHVSSLYRKLGKHHRTELALVALRHGLRPARLG